MAAVAEGAHATADGRSTLNTPAPRSSFITLLAWSTIGLAVLNLVTALLQAVVMQVLLPQGLDGLLPGGVSLGAGAGGLLSLLSAVFVVLTLFSLWLGVALLQRREWARQALVGMLWFGIALSLLFGIGGMLAYIALRDASLLPPDLPVEGLQGLLSATAILFVVLSVASIAVHGWLVKRLQSSAIRAEFAAPVAV